MEALIELGLGFATGGAGPVIHLSRLAGTYPHCQASCSFGRMTR